MPRIRQMLQNWTKQNTNSSLPAQRLQQPWVAKPQQLRLSPSPKAEAGWTSHQRVCTATIVAVAACRSNQSWSRLGFMGYCKFMQIQQFETPRSVVERSCALYLLLISHSLTNQLIDHLLYVCFNRQPSFQSSTQLTHPLNKHRSTQSLTLFKSLISFISLPYRFFSFSSWKLVDPSCLPSLEVGWLIGHTEGVHQENDHQSWDSGLSLGFL